MKPLINYYDPCENCGAVRDNREMIIDTAGNKFCNDYCRDKFKEKNSK